MTWRNSRRNQTKANAKARRSAKEAAKQNLPFAASFIDILAFLVFLTRFWRTLRGSCVVGFSEALLQHPQGMNRKSHFGKLNRLVKRSRALLGTIPTRNSLTRRHAASMWPASENSQALFVGKPADLRGRGDCCQPLAAAGAMPPKSHHTTAGAAVIVPVCLRRELR